MQQWTGVGGKRVVITGASGGIGLAAAHALAARGALVTIVARSQARASAAARRIEAGSAGGAPVDVLTCDLSSQAALRALAVALLERYPRIDVLVNNAGAMYAKRQQSANGIELTWALNHLAPFLLSALLLARLRESAPARIVTTSSDAHRGARIPFDDLGGGRIYGARGLGPLAAPGFRRYGQTKLANILFTAELARRIEGTGVTANCFHPGFVATGFNRNNGPWSRVAMTLARPAARTPARGARTLVWLVDSPACSEANGGYFFDEHPAEPSPQGRDGESARRLWELSEAQVGERPA